MDKEGDGNKNLESEHIQGSWGGGSDDDDMMMTLVSEVAVVVMMVKVLEVTMRSQRLEMSMMREEMTMRKRTTGIDIWLTKMTMKMMMNLLTSQMMLWVPRMARGMLTRWICLDLQLFRQICTGIGIYMNFKSAHT